MISDWLYTHKQFVSGLVIMIFKEIFMSHVYPLRTKANKMITVRLDTLYIQMYIFLLLISSKSEQDNVNNILCITRGKASLCSRINFKRFNPYVWIKCTRKISWNKNIKKVKYDSMHLNVHWFETCYRNCKKYLHLHDLFSWTIYTEEIFSAHCTKHVLIQTNILT